GEADQPSGGAGAGRALAVLRGGVLRGRAQCPRGWRRLRSQRHRYVNGKESQRMSKEVYDRGLKIRREVLGAEYVDKALATADAFGKPLQDLVTEYCWGAVWGREELP